MSEIKSTNKKAIPLWVSFLVILVSIVLAYYNQFFGAFALIAASVMAYDYDSRLKIPISSIVVFVAGITCYYLNYSHTPLFSTMCLASSFSAVAGILTNMVFKDIKFFEGLIYSIVFSIIIMVLSTVMYYYLSGEKQLIDVILLNLEAYFANTKSVFIDEMMSVISRNIEFLESNLTFADLLKPVEIQEKSILMENTMPFFDSLVREEYPVFIVIYPLLNTGITWWIGNRLKYRTVPMTKEGPFQKPKPFAAFRYPRWMVNVIMLLILASFILQLSGGSDLITYISLTLQSISLFLIGIQGTAVLEFLLKRNSLLKNTILRVVVLALIIFLFAGIIPLMVGMMDIIINIRYLFANKDKFVIKK